MSESGITDFISRAGNGNLSRGGKKWYDKENEAGQIPTRINRAEKCRGVLREPYGQGGFTMLERLKEQVYLANLELPKRGLVTDTWGNVSGFDRETGLIVIKPSGVAYEALTPEELPVVDLTGKVVEGRYIPSSDTPTHLEIYHKFPLVGGIVHTHSPWAAAWAQAGRSIPCYGTTHADHFYGQIPCTRDLSESEIKGAYEKNTGLVILETIGQSDPFRVPGILCAHHGPFAWGTDPARAVQSAVILEEVAKIAYHTERLNPNAQAVNQALLDRHYLRKNGAGAYYGQKTGAR